MRNRFWAGVAAAAVLAGGTARADFVATDVEPNNVFAARQVLPAGPGVVTGSIVSGDVDNFQFSLSPGAQFAAAIIAGNFDTILGQRDNVGGIIRTDDDSGAGLFSLLTPAAVPAGGQVNIAVTGFPDFGLTGAHTASGTYTLAVQQLTTAADTGVNNTFATRQVLAAGVNTVTGTITPGDVDFFTFTGLIPGTVFGANIAVGNFDTVLGNFSSAGTLVVADDDDGAGLLSALASQTVGADGTVTLAVSGFADFGFAGGHAQNGSYTLILFAQPAAVAPPAVIPEPASMALLAAGGLGLAGYRRLRRAAA